MFSRIFEKNDKSELYIYRLVTKVLTLITKTLFDLELVDESNEFRVNIFRVDGQDGKEQISQWTSTSIMGFS